MIRPCYRNSERAIGRVLVLEHGQLPSTEIYIRSRLKATNMPDTIFLDISREAPPPANVEIDLDEGVFVVVCRYITRPWMSWLEGVRDRLSGVAFFADDDLPGMMRENSLPLRYRLKLWRLFGIYQRRLSAVTSDLWVASEELAARYADCSPRLLPPLYLTPLSDNPVRYFYHGTAVHKAEAEWMVEVVRRVQDQNDDAVFEIIGTQQFRRLFKGIERVVVIHPMTWPTYRAHSESGRLAIGLAPLLQNPINDARSHNRFYDITRSAAVGIYSDRPPYAGFVRDGVDGILLPDDKDMWAETVSRLLENKAQRDKMLAEARSRCLVDDHSLAFLAQGMA